MLEREVFYYLNFTHSFVIHTFLEFYKIRECNEIQREDMCTRVCTEMGGYT